MVLSQCRQLQGSKCCHALIHTRQAVRKSVRRQHGQQQLVGFQKLGDLLVCNAAAVEVQPESTVPGMSSYLDSLRWSKDGLVPVIVQVGLMSKQHGTCLLARAAMAQPSGLLCSTHVCSVLVTGAAPCSCSSNCINHPTKHSTCSTLQSAHHI